MTCVVGVVHNGTIFMGADSAALSDLRLRVRRDPKVFRVGPYLIGYTWSYRMGQLLRFNLDVPSPLDHDDERHMTTTFIDAVRRCLREGGFAKVENGQETGGQFMVGYRGSIYRIESDFQVAVNAEIFDAIGCGADIALGALFVSHIHGAPPRQQIDHALRAAERFSAGVRGPYLLEELPMAVLP